MDLCVQNDVEHDHPSGFHQVIDAVVVGEYAPNVIGDGLEPRLARIGRHGIGGQPPDSVHDFVFGPFRADEGSALKLANDALNGRGGPVCEDDISLHTRNVGTRGQRRG